MCNTSPYMVIPLGASFISKTRVQNRSIILTVPKYDAQLHQIEEGWYVKVFLEPIKKEEKTLNKTQNKALPDAVEVWGFTDILLSPQTLLKSLLFEPQMAPVIEM